MSNNKVVILDKNFHPYTINNPLKVKVVVSE